MLVLQGLSHRFDGSIVLNNFDLTLQAGELVCLIGPNGCGKTTVFNAICGHIQVQTGTVLWQGADLRGLALHAIVRRGIGRKFQTPALFAAMSVAQHRDLATYARAQATQPVPWTTMAPLLEPLWRRLPPHALAHTLAHGQRQWLELAMVLTSGPRLVLLDEPTAGMTHAQTAELVALLQKLCVTTGQSLLVVEHDMRCVAALGARVVVMNEGRVIADGPYAQIRTLSQVQHAYLGPQADA